MADLFKNELFRITENEVINLETGERFSTSNIKGKRAITFEPPLRDYLGWGFLAILGIWLLSNSWIITGLIALGVGGFGIYISTQRKPKYCVTVWFIGDTFNSLDFNTPEDMNAAAEAVQRLADRNQHRLEND